MLGLALSGGGIRGIAHAGALKAFEDNGISFDVVGGTSAGALVGALYALGYSPSYIFEAFKMYSKEIVGLNSGYVFSGIFGKENKVSGLKTGYSLEKVYNKIALRKGIEFVKDVTGKILLITAVDVKNAKEYIFTNSVPNVENTDKYITDISIGKAVRASSSFPAIFCPCEYKGHSFYDGGVLDNIPVLEVKKQGADKKTRSRQSNCNKL